MFAALEPGDVFTRHELAKATAALPQEGRDNSAETLARALEGMGTQAAEYWRNRVAPYLKKVPDYVRTSCSKLRTGAGTKFGPLTWRRAAHLDRFGGRWMLPTAQSTRSIEQDELGA